MKADVEKLKRARDLVARPNGWCQDYYAVDENGVALDPDEHNFVENPPCQVCALGALIAAGVSAAAYGADDATPETELLFKATRTRVHTIHDWNDAPRRKQTEVVAAFDRAIVLAEAQT